MARPSKVYSWVRYFLVADLMKVQFDTYIRSHPFDEGVAHSDEWPVIMSLMSVWYGTLYVVVEGWTRLGLADTKVDEYLGNAELLRSLENARNGAFHFKSTYWDISHRDFIVRGEESAVWVRGLHYAFSAFVESLSQPGSLNAG